MDRKEDTQDQQGRNKGQGRSDQAWKSLSYASVGIEMAVATVIGWGFGYYLDERFDTYPVLMLIFLLLGVAAGFRGLIRAAQQAKRDARESNE
jgi:ATP synthase protein I